MSSSDSTLRGAIYRLATGAVSLDSTQAKTFLSIDQPMRLTTDASIGSMTMTTDTPESNVPESLDDPEVRAGYAGRLFDVPPELVRSPRQKDDPRQAALFAEEPLRDYAKAIGEKRTVIPSGGVTVIRPGDKVILVVGQCTSMQNAERMLEAARRALPNCEISVIGCESILVYRPEEGK